MTTADELLGIAPDWCNGQSVDEYVRESRERGKTMTTTTAIKVRTIVWFANGRLEICTGKAGTTADARAIKAEPFQPDQADAMLRAMGYARVSDWSALGQFHRAVIS